MNEPRPPQARQGHSASPDSVFEEIAHLVTEARNPNTMEIDRAPVSEILRLISAEDMTVPAAVARELPYIEKAVEHTIRALRAGGRLLYVGAGTSGRLGVLDASECPPTFGTAPDTVQGIIAGGYGALIRSKEGAEDLAGQGALDLLDRDLTAADVVVGIAASRRTPYVAGALAKARETGATTVLLTCNPRAQISFPVDVAICPVVGPEVVMGSTRMKAGTAQKLVLNMLTTATMIRMGKLHGNMMVDLQLTSRKLVERAKRIIMIATDAPYDRASELLDQAQGSVKAAIVMAAAGVDRSRALVLLDRADGFVYRALQLTSSL